MQAAHQLQHHLPIVFICLSSIPVLSDKVLLRLPAFPKALFICSCLPSKAKGCAVLCFHMFVAVCVFNCLQRIARKLILPAGMHESSMHTWSPTCMCHFSCRGPGHPRYSGLTPGRAFSSCEDLHMYYAACRQADGKECSCPLQQAGRGQLLAGRASRSVHAVPP